MNRDELRARIDTMERLHDVIGAIDDLAVAELRADEIDIRLYPRNTATDVIAVAHNMPLALVLIGLRAMQHELEAQLISAEVIEA